MTIPFIVFFFKIQTNIELHYFHGRILLVCDILNSNIPIWGLIFRATKTQRHPVVSNHIQNFIHAESYSISVLCGWQANYEPRLGNSTEEKVLVCVSTHPTKKVFLNIKTYAKRIIKTNPWNVPSTNLNMPARQEVN